MSIQGNIESVIVAQVAIGLPGVIVIQGPVTTPRAEGSGRFAAVRKTSGTGTRLEFGQTLWVEQYALTVFWHASSITRETSALEWETFLASIATDPQLGLIASFPTLEQAYVSSQLWGEAHEGHFRTMSATLTVERVE